MLLLEAIAATVDTINRWLGRLLGAVALALILLQFTLVMASHVFAANAIWLQEMRLYLNAAIFLGAVGYCLASDEHVRVDIFYRRMDERRRMIVDLTGAVLFLLPTGLLVLIAGWPYVASSWATLEGSTETGGLQAVFVLKSFILLFGLQLLAQGAAVAIRAVRGLTGHEYLTPPHDYQG